MNLIRKYKNKIIAFLLLLTYLISNCTSFIFHHHNFQVITFDKATSCDKEIYFADKEGKCKHKSHFLKATEKCFFCDNYNITDHLLASPFYTIQNISLHNIYNFEIIHLISSHYFISTNKDPPIV